MGEHGGSCGGGSATCSTADWHRCGFWGEEKEENEERLVVVVVVVLRFLSDSANSHRCVPFCFAGAVPAAAGFHAVGARCERGDQATHAGLVCGKRKKKQGAVGGEGVCVYDCGAWRARCPLPHHLLRPCVALCLGCDACGGGSVQFRLVSRHEGTMDQHNAQHAQQTDTRTHLTISCDVANH